VTPKTPPGGTFDTPGNATSLIVEGHRAYVADFDQGVQIIDIANPTALKFVNNLRSAGLAFSVALSGDFAYVAAGPAG